MAGAPTTLYPSFVKATIEGVVLAPSAFSITLGVWPSITATQLFKIKKFGILYLFVVPRSIPITNSPFETLESEKRLTSLFACNF